MSAAAGAVAANRRRSAVKARTVAANQINAVAVTAPEHLRDRLRGLKTPEMVKVCARWRLDAAGDNPQRMRSEASFAALCGASPIEASSGPRVRHRLNRGGNR